MNAKRTLQLAAKVEPASKKPSCGVVAELAGVLKNPEVGTFGRSTRSFCYGNTLDASLVLIDSDIVFDQALSSTARPAGPDSEAHLHRRPYWSSVE
jgi:hypothetical protein